MFSFPLDDVACNLVQQRNLTFHSITKSRLEFFRDLDCDVFSWDDFICEDYDLVVNSTSAGLKDDYLPCNKEILIPILTKASFAFDCVYGKITPFLALAKENNCEIKDGEDMLLYQGVLAFELFTSIKADNKVVKVMKEALRNS